ncbi:MAG: mannose-1-phosphate guanylyltransferase/mannose-6-phosphate isomerase [Bauldia sp.]|nr:mannose-1-phosphate guanylyltransferase/mannose-6-phosphate isomerase [Bauldia sp.]
MPRIIPVILSGGTGTRLWPLSRQSYPKQLLALAGEGSLLQQAALRGKAIAPDEAPMVIANAEHRFVVAEQLRAAGIAQSRIVLEPVGRNTAPAVAVAALLAVADDPEAVILVMPSDHVIGDNAAFAGSVAVAAVAAAAGEMVLFGIPPTRPETGYGYIRSGAALPGLPGVSRVDAFVEKPDLPTAERYLATGAYAWNSGIFVLPAAGVIAALEAFTPAVVAAARAAIESAASDLDFLRLGEAAFAAAPSIAIDRAVMERTDRAAVMAAPFSWSDAGTWSALWDIGARDADGNVLTGDAVAFDTRNSYLRSDGPMVAAVGLDDVVVVATGDAVLVAHRGASQDVGELVKLLKERGSSAATTSPWVHRPWGFYQSVHSGERFQVKRITVNPGARLSLQRHYHRAEHWVVVNGTALVTRDNEQVLLRENEAIFLPQGCVHRLENPGKTPLNLIEVQSGGYLGEDDIVRIEDDFAR